MRHARSLPLAHERAAPKGRGTGWMLQHRFSADAREAADDGWGSLEQQAQAQPLPAATQVIEENVGRILSGNDSPDIGFDLSINPYRGCEHDMWNSQLLTADPR